MKNNVASTSLLYFWEDSSSFFCVPLYLIHLLFLIKKYISAKGRIQSQGHNNISIYTFIHKLYNIWKLWVWLVHLFFYTKLHSLEEATRSLVSVLRASLMQYQSSLYICVCVCVCASQKTTKFLNIGTPMGAVIIWLSF